MDSLVFTDTSDCKNKVRSFLAKYINAELDDHDNFFERGYVNSLFAMQLVTFIENTFRIKIENEDLEVDNFNSVAAISTFVNRKHQPREV